MPHKPINLILKTPEWVDAIADPCLHETVLEALVARRAAVQREAEKHPNCARALKSADTTLARIADGRDSGSAACRKAATALRKYNTAAECAIPTASHGGRAA